MKVVHVGRNDFVDVRDHDLALLPERRVEKVQIVLYRPKVIKVLQVVLKYGFAVFVPL